jgi:NAD(P)-dependent dehydrogenase (short-subunit alcohol dehydrogenase family)
MTDRKLATITGANSGVGLETARCLVQSGWAVVLVCRSEERGSRAMAELRSDAPGAELHLEVCDLGVLDDVRALVGRLESWLDQHDRELHALVNNAGVYRARLERTPDGFEMTMAVNHLSHFLVTLLLEPRLRRSGVRIVNVASEGHRRGKLGRRSLEHVLRGHGSYGGVQAYCDSKLANVLFTEELQRRWGRDGVAVASVHPGMLSTAIWDRNNTPLMWIMRLMKPFMSPPSEGGSAVARLLDDVPLDALKGAYFNRDESVSAGSPDDGGVLARQMWDASERAVGMMA